MTEQLKKLDQSEINQLLDVVPLITVLVAGADGKIEQKEKEWAKKITNIRTFASEKILREYYQSVTEHFENRVETLIDNLPPDTEERNDRIAQELAKVNPILQKLDQEYAAYLYESFISFAKHVAKAAGGFLSFFTISSEEKQWLSLPMIDVIEMPEKEEEDPS